MNSPRLKARLAGLFYFLTGGAGFAFMVRGKLIVPADAAATATNILAHERLFRFALLGDLLGVASYVVVTALLYELLRPVNRSVSLIAAFMSLVGCITEVFACVFDFVALQVVHDPATALMLTRMQAQGFNIAIVFFGFYCILIGILIVRSTFLPRIIGVLMALGGLAYVVNNLAHFMAVPVPHGLTPFVLILPGLGEGSVMLWLLIAGVNAQRWNEQAGRDPRLPQAA